MRFQRVQFNYVLLLAVVFGGFLVFGLSENVKGPAIPGIQAEFLLDEGQLGWLLALNALGYLAACSFTSYLSDKIGIKWTGIAAFVSMAAAGLCMYMSVTYGYLAASYALLYIGNGMLEIGLAIMAARIFTKHVGTMMNISHFFYGLSSMGAPMLAASMMGWSVPALGGELGWRGMYAVVLALSLLPAVFALAAKFPADNQEAAERASLGALARDPVAWMIVLVLSFGVVSELAVGSWLVYYLEKAYGWSTERASRMLSLFFLCFMLSRLVIGPITDKFGYTRSIMAVSAFSGLCSLAALAVGERGAWLFAVAGAGIAPIYPTVMAMVAKRYPHGTGTAITFTVSLMGVASVVGNIGIGALIDAVRGAAAVYGDHESRVIGLQAGYALIAVLALFCSVSCLFMQRMLRKRGETL